MGGRGGLGRREGGGGVQEGETEVGAVEKLEAGGAGCQAQLASHPG